MSRATLLQVVDMRLYKDGDGTTPVYPPEDLEYGRVKSMDGDEGEWRLVAVEWCHVFGNAEYTDEDKKNSLVKGYGRVTVLEKYPQEVFHEFAFWDDGMCPPWTTRTSSRAGTRMMCIGSARG